jgi:hypothetical protein
MEVRGISGGVTVIDDFGHHPTAIRETLRALRGEVCAGKNLGHLRAAQQHDPPECVSAGTRRDSFADADGVMISQIARLELLAPEERLNPEQLITELKAAGKNAAYLAGRRRHRHPRRNGSATRRRGLRVQQRRFWRHSREAVETLRPKITEHEIGFDFDHGAGRLFAGRGGRDQTHP